MVLSCWLGLNHDNRKLGCRVRQQTYDEKEKRRACWQTHQNASGRGSGDSPYPPGRQRPSARGPRGEYSTRREGIDTGTFLYVSFQLALI